MYDLYCQEMLSRHSKNHTKAADSQLLGNESQQLGVALNVGAVNGCCPEQGV